MWNCVCKLLSEVCWEVNLFQQGKLECIKGSGEPESSVLHLNTLKLGRKLGLGNAAELLYFVPSPVSVSEWP